MAQTLGVRLARHGWKLRTLDEFRSLTGFEQPAITHLHTIKKSLNDTIAARPISLLVSSASGWVWPEPYRLSGGPSGPRWPDGAAMDGHPVGNSNETQMGGVGDELV